MKKKIFLIILLFADFSIALLYSKSLVPDVLYFADLVKNTQYTGYADFEKELYYDNIDAPHNEKEDLYPDFLYLTKKQNLYCSQIHLAGIKDKTLAVMNLEGSGQFSYFRIFRYKKKAKKWTIYYSSRGEKGECGLIFPVQYKKETLFLQIEKNFDNKRLSAYNLISLNVKKRTWNKIASAYAHYKYNLSAEQKEWISAEKIQKMAAFDYSDLGIEGHHPEKIQVETGDKKL